MKKFFVNCLCAFIPNTDKRRAFRKKLMRDRITEIQEKLFSLQNEVKRLNEEKQNVFNEPTEYVFHGENNKLLVWDNDKNDYVESNRKIQGLTLNIVGNDNIVKIKDISIIRMLNIDIVGNGNLFELGAKTKKSPYVHVYSFCCMHGIGISCIIGDNPFFQPGCILHLCENYARMRIGDNVLIAENVKIFASDAHPIVDIKTNKVINYGDGKRVLKVGNDCWIGACAFLQKNTSLQDFTIVGAQSVVTKGFKEQNIVIAGNPAKIIKRGVMRVDLWEDALKRYAV